MSCFSALVIVGDINCSFTVKLYKKKKKRQVFFWGLIKAVFIDLVFGGEKEETTLL